MSKVEKLDHLAVSAFSESMAMMIKSGVTTDEALHLMKGDSHGILADTLGQMAGEADEGKSLSAVMESTGAFPQYALEMVKAGEVTGNLESVMSHLADYYRNEKETTDKLRSAVVYPLSMIAMIIIVLIIMLVLVLPAFSDVYASLSAASAGYMKIAYLICRILLAVMIALVVAAAIGLLMWNTGKKQQVEDILSHIPLCASIFQQMGKYRFTSALAIYLSSGHMQDEAVVESKKLTDCRAVEAKLDSCLKEMEEGHGFAYAANKHELYEAIYGRMLVPAERSGNIEEVLHRLSGLIKDDVSNSVSNLVNTVEPLLSGLLMISIGLVLISLMLPLIGMMNSIG